MSAFLGDSSAVCYLLHHNAKREEGESRGKSRGLRAFGGAL